MNPNLLLQIAGQFNGFSKEEIAREGGEYGFSTCERKIIDLLLKDGRFLKWASDDTLMIPVNEEKLSPPKEEEHLQDENGWDIDENGERIDSDHNMWLKQDLGLIEE